MAVAAGQSHTVVAGQDGCVFSFGFNYAGQLGVGDNGTRLAPARLTGLTEPVRQVAAGQGHTGIVTDAGDLLMCGCGRGGRLGLGDKEDQATPTQVARAAFDGEAVLMVACGMEHTVVATEGGGVYTFGSGIYGRLGHGDEEDQLVPRRVPAAGFNCEQVVMVAAGGVHTVALSEAGHVFTWGSGEVGQLGHDDREELWAPRQVEAGRFGGEQVVFVAAGKSYTVAVTAGGRLYTWGLGARGQLGHGDTGSRLVPTLVGGPTGPAFGAPEGGRVVMAACGGRHTLVVTQDGGLWACGSGYQGRLGLNDEADRPAFERLGGTTGAAFGGARVVAAAVGYMHSVAVTEDGALWTWGAGFDGRLGRGNEEHCLVPTRVPVASLQNTRIGRCRPLPRGHAVALAMGTHSRLGAASPVRVLGGEVSLLTMIAGFSGAWVGGVAGRSEGLVRLLGGVTANPAHRYQLETVG